MTPDKITFSHPATKVASCMAVASGLPGVFPSNVAVLAVSEFRKTFPELAARFDALRAEAALRGPACGDTASAEGVPEFVTPPSNTGVNKALSLAQGSK
jgi:hypothetical protein